MAETVHLEQQRAAKVAGLAYLLSFAVVVYAFFGLRASLVVHGDMAATVRRIGAAEGLFRLSATFDVLYAIGVVVLIGALYTVLAPVNRHVALLAALLRSVQAVLAVLVVLALLLIVRLAGGAAYAQLLGAQGTQGLVQLTFDAGEDQYYVGLVFWGLSSTLLGWLWLKSRYVPAALAWFGIVSSAWAALSALVYLTSPGFRGVVNWWWYDSPLGLFELVLGFWLLLKGLRAQEGSR